MPKRRHRNISGVTSDEEESDESYDSTEPSTSQRVVQSQATRRCKTTPVPHFSSQPADVSSKQRVVLAQLGSQLTDFEKKIIVDKVLKRIVSKYFLTQRTFRKTAMFLPEDKIKPKQQDLLIPLINEKLKEFTKLELVTDGNRFMISIPKALHAEILSQNHHSQNTEHMTENINTENVLCSQPVQPPDDITHVVLIITLAVIYFYRGKILEDELIEKRLPQILPVINSFFFSSKDLTKTMQDFEQRAFIEKKMSVSDSENPPKVYMYWGFRAKTEVDKKSLIPIYCKLADCTTDDLPLWLNEAIENNVDF